MNDARKVDCGAQCPPASEFDHPPQNREQLDEELARLAKAIAHPVRVAILRTLLAKKSCVCGELVSELPLAQSTVSQHLKQMKAAGLIRGTVDGPRVCYCAEPAAIDRLKKLVVDL